MIVRAEFCPMVSSTWFAKNMIAVSIIANSSAKNTGATSANSTAAEPRRVRRNRRNVFCNEAVEVAGDVIEESPSGQRCSARNKYLKLIVEMFQQQEAGPPALLT